VRLRSPNTGSLVWQTMRSIELAHVESVQLRRPARFSGDLGLSSASGQKLPLAKARKRNPVAWRLRGDLSEMKKPLRRAAFELMLTNQHLTLVAGIGFEPMTIRL